MIWEAVSAIGCQAGYKKKSRREGLRIVRFAAVWLAVTAPALHGQELEPRTYKNYRQDAIIGASLEVTAPGGQYDDGRLLNLGTNHWSVKPEIGVSKHLGPVTLELAGGVRFYTDNDDFFGGRLREQEPIYSIRGHFIYSFSHDIWAALDGTFYTGGQITVDGVKRNNRQENTRLGVTVALPVNRQNSVKLYFSTGVSTRAGTDFDTAGIVWQYRFGGGL